ncbi:MAG: hypothetical protein NTV75_03690 [Bacteroidia bacterium]|nr:hypothetical protein [Bacteroidia bacterium]
MNQTLFRRIGIPDVNDTFPAAISLLNRPFIEKKAAFFPKSELRPDSLGLSREKILPSHPAQEIKKNATFATAFLT